MDFTISIFGLDFSHKVEKEEFEDRFVNLKVAHDLLAKVLPYRKQSVDDFCFIILRELMAEYNNAETK